MEREDNESARTTDRRGMTVASASRCDASVPVIRQRFPCSAARDIIYARNLVSAADDTRELMHLSCCYLPDRHDVLVTTKIASVICVQNYDPIHNAGSGHAWSMHHNKMTNHPSIRTYADEVCGARFPICFSRLFYEL